MFPFICIWINDWVNNREAGDLRRYRAHYDVIVIYGTNTAIKEKNIVISGTENITHNKTCGQCGLRTLFSATELGQYSAQVMACCLTAPRHYLNTTLTYHEWVYVAFTKDQFHRKWSWYQFVTWVWKYTLDIPTISPRRQWVDIKTRFYL